MSTYKKESIPKAVREQVWVKRMGKSFEGKCTVTWCTNQITVFDFHVGHNTPESKGGTLSISNLEPICARCNLSMSDKFTISEWNRKFAPEVCCVGCFGSPHIV
jgi:5-methylcytosine-specific restriction endonuclease McrA